MKLGLFCKKATRLTCRLLRPAMVMVGALSQINSRVCEIFQKIILEKNRTALISDNKCKSQQKF